MVKKGEQAFYVDFFGYFETQHEAFFSQIISQNKVKTVIELGTFLAKGAINIATLLPSDGTVYTVDHWQGAPEIIEREPHRMQNLREQCLFNIQSSKVKHKIRVIEGYTLEVETPDEVDLVYIDASHRTPDVIADIKHYYPKVKKNGGILCGDDYDWPEVIEGVEQCKSFLPPVYVFSNRIWYCQLGA